MLILHIRLNNNLLIDIPLIDVPFIDGNSD